MHELVSHKVEGSALHQNILAHAIEQAIDRIQLEDKSAVEE